MSTDERALGDGLRRGDLQALALAFEQNRDALQRMVAFRIDPRLRGRVSASDVVQGAYLEAAKRLAHFGERAELSPALWLRWVVSQHLIDLHRRQLARKRGGTEAVLSLDRGASWAAASSAALAELLAAREASPSAILGGEERCAQLARALAALAPLDREILALRHFEELGNDEVAALLGLERSAASKRYVRALGRLRTALAGDPRAEPPVIAPERQQP
jgi:RNA polymerase sigma-70 factor (ECF subfamily)